MRRWHRPKCRNLSRYGRVPERRGRTLFRLPASQPTAFSQYPRRALSRQSDVLTGRRIARLSEMPRQSTGRPARRCERRKKTCEHELAARDLGHRLVLPVTHRSTKSKASASCRIASVTTNRKSPQKDRIGHFSLEILHHSEAADLRRGGHHGRAGARRITTNSCKLVPQNK